jgi:amino acid transporter
MIGVVIVLVFSIAHKVVYRTKLRRSDQADLVTGRRTLQEPEIALLREYYSRPAWRRAFTYVKFW